MLDHIKKYLGLGTSLILLITLGLFIAALFAKGFTHDLLLETAVFLISVKLIILSYRNTKGVEAIQDKLDVILSEEKHLEKVLNTIKNIQANREDSEPKKQSTDSAKRISPGEKFTRLLERSKNESDDEKRI